MNSFWIIKFKLPSFFLSKHFFVRREKFLHRKNYKNNIETFFLETRMATPSEILLFTHEIGIHGEEEHLAREIVVKRRQDRSKRGGGWLEKSREQSWRRRGPRSKFSRIFGIFPFGNGTRNLGKQIPSAEFVPIDRRRVCFSCRQPVEIPKGDELSCCDKNAGLRGWGW